MLVIRDFVETMREHDTNPVDMTGDDIRLSLLEQISPIEWDNVVLYGEYQLNKRLIRP